MTHRSKLVTRVTAVVVLTGLVACGDMSGTDRASVEASSLTAPSGADTGRGTNPDTSPTDPDSVRPDTTTHPDTGTNPDTGTGPDSETGPDTTIVPGDTIPDAVIDGTMIGIDSTRTPFIELGPIPGVVITVFRWRGVDSSGTRPRPLQDSVGVTISGRDGKFNFDSLRHGIYVLRAVPPEGSGYLPGQMGVTAYSIRSLVLLAPLKFYLHKRR